MSTTITNVIVRDIRFPTSATLDGSDAMNPDPDYSATYVVLQTDSPRGLRGVGYVDHLHEHFVFPVTIRNGNYLPPLEPGYSIEMKADSLDYHEFPNGQAWKR